MNPHLDDSTSEHLLAVTDTGVVQLWNVSAAAGKKKSQAPDGTVTASDVPILAAQFSSQAQLLVVAGTLVKPSFERVQYVSEEQGDIKRSTQITTLSAAAAVSVLLPAQTPTPAEKTRDPSRTAKAVLGQTDQPVPSASTLQKVKQGKTTSEPTLQERLDSLRVAPEGSRPASAPATPKADSLQAVLVQALHTNDAALLESCLAVTDPTVIRNTVSRLPSQYVLPFLQVVIDKFTSKPTRASSILTWIRAVLVQHTSYLMSVPDLAKSLSGLYMVVENRLQVYKKLLKLSGRLDLVLAQVTARTSEIEASAQAVTVYEEPEGSDEEEEGVDDADSDEEDQDDDSAAEEDGEQDEEAESEEDEDDEDADSDAMED